jgi:hypothetical protein
MYQATLGICSSEVTTDCVSGVEATGNNGKSLEVKNLGPLETSPDTVFKGNSDFELPTGAQPFIVDIPGAPHEGGSNYLVTVVDNGHKLPKEKKFTHLGIQAAIWAVQLKSGTYTLSKVGTTLEDNRYLGLTSTYGSSCDEQPGGLIGSKTQCAIKKAMPTDVNFKINLVLSTKAAGWFIGRASNVQANVKTNSAGQQMISISGNPVKVPTIYGWIPRATAPAALSDFYSKMSDLELNGGSGFTSSTGTNWLRGMGYDQRSLNELTLWLPIIKDTAAVAPATWEMKSDSSSLSALCPASDSLQGIVTSNATVYLAGPPTFDKAEQSFDYKVLAPHFLPDGTVFKGTYDLLINSSLARCIYNFTDAPIKATVSVVSATGENQVITSVVSEKEGFIRLTAAGFTFSNPTIKVKLTQEVPVVAPVPVETKAPVAKKITITCTKGKTTKKVTAVKPVCPKGYKKK